MTETATPTAEETAAQAQLDRLNAERNQYLRAMTEAISPIREQAKAVVLSLGEVADVLVENIYSLRRTFTRRVVPGAPEKVKAAFQTGAPDIAGRSDQYRKTFGDWWKVNVSQDETLAGFSGQLSSILDNRVPNYVKDHATPDEMYAAGLSATKKAEADKKRKQASAEEKRAATAALAAALGSKPSMVNDTLDVLLDRALGWLKQGTAKLSDNAEAFTPNAEAFQAQIDAIRTECDVLVNLYGERTKKTETAKPVEEIEKVEEVAVA